MANTPFFGALRRDPSKTVEYTWGLLEIVGRDRYFGRHYEVDRSVGIIVVSESLTETEDVFIRRAHPFKSVFGFTEMTEADTRAAARRQFDGSARPT